MTTPPTATPPTRPRAVYLNGQVILEAANDPGPTVTDDQLRTMLLPFYPGLANTKLERRETDAAIELRYTKQAAQKG